VALVLNDLADVAEARGDHEAARALNEQGLALWRELGDRWGLAYVLEGFAALAIGQSQHERGVCLLAAARRLRRAIGMPGAPARQAKLQRLLEAAREGLDEAVYREANARGEALSLEAAIAAALER
jgi:hypothetical protein